LLGAAAGLGLRCFPSVLWYAPASAGIGLLTGVRSFRSMLLIVEIVAGVLTPVLMVGLLVVMGKVVSRRFEKRLTKALAQRLSPAEGAIFAGIHPGTGVRFTEGFADWDFGFFTMEEDWLCYRGEKARFAISRQEVTAIDIVQGHLTWERERRIEIASRGGVFTLNTHFSDPSRAKLGRTVDQLRKWVAAAESAQPAGSAPEPPPDLPHLPGQESSRIRPLLYVGKMAFQSFILGTVVALLARGSLLSTVAAAFIAFVAPIGVLVHVLPGILWPVRRPLTPAG
jgi:hypothetical protein